MSEEICTIDAAKHSYRQTKSGIVVSFLIHPSDDHKKLMELALEDVVRLHITKEDIGI